jgi:hypothetical protein
MISILMSRIGERVRWFRLEAEVRRWREQHERKQFEFLCLILALERERDSWTACATTHPKPGYAAYAHRHAAMYTEMIARTKQRLKAAGYEDLLSLPADEPIYKHFERARATELSNMYSNAA